MVNVRRVAVGVHHGYHWNVEYSSLFDGNLFAVGIDHEQDVRRTRHVLDAPQVLVQVFSFSLEARHLFLGAAFVALFFCQHIQLFQALDGVLHGRPVREQPSQPAAVDEIHLTALGFGGNCFLGLALGAHEQHGLAFRGGLGNEAGGVLEHLQSFLKVNDVDAVAFAEDILSHLRIPAPGLVPEMNA